MRTCARPCAPPRRALPVHGRALTYTSSPHPPRLGRYAAPTARRSRVWVRAGEVVGVIGERRDRPSAGVEPVSAGPRARPHALKSLPVPRRSPCLSLPPSPREQVSAAQRTCGRAELALRRRCYGCRLGWVLPTAQVLLCVLFALRRCGAAPWSTSGPNGPRRCLRRRVQGKTWQRAGDCAREAAAGRAVGCARGDFPPRLALEACSGSRSSAVATPRVAPGPAHAGSQVAPAHGAAFRAAPAVRTPRLCLEKGRLKAALAPRKAAEKPGYSGDFFSSASVVKS